MNLQITGELKKKDFDHLFAPFDLFPSQGFYFICGNYHKNNVYRDQFYFCTEGGDLFYYSCFNEWRRSHNKEDHFVNLKKLV